MVLPDTQRKDRPWPTSKDNSSVRPRKPERSIPATQDADELVGDQIAVTGDVEIVDFPERGKILVFRATSVAVLEEDEEVEEVDLS
jgi:hypothetical protein